MITLTTTSCHLQAGDIVSVQLLLTKRERFLMWLARPWKWPPRMHQSNMVISLVVGSSCAEGGWL